MSVKVKICGIRRLESAQAAINAGADYLGFNFVPTSKRYIPPLQAKEIIDKLQIINDELRIKFVGIFQNQSVAYVNNTADFLELDLVQLHGEENDDYMKRIRRNIIKSIVVSENELRNDKVKYCLLDRITQGEGEMVDLEKAKEIANIFSTFFAGGLTSENVAEVIKIVRPFGVDVSSGIETNGVEDPAKIRLFIQRAKNIPLSLRAPLSGVRQSHGLEDRDGIASCLAMTESRKGLTI